MVILVPSPVADLYGAITTNNIDEILNYPFQIIYVLGENFFVADVRMTDIRMWLIENISAPRNGAIGNITNSYNTVEYLFRTAEDLMALKLRWL